MPLLPSIRARQTPLFAALVLASSACGEAPESEENVATAQSAVGPVQCITIQRTGASGTVADAYIAPGLGNRGASSTLETALLRYGLLRFDLGAVPAGADVTSATLSLSYRDLGKGAAAPGIATLHRITGPWAESTVTFANFGFPLAPGVAAQLSVPRTFGVYKTTTADLTSLVQAWRSGTPNHGVLIAETWLQGTQYRSSEAAAGRPQLEVCFVAASPCEPNPCANGGTCAVSGSVPVCSCPAGWSGPTCAVDTDGCSSNPCFDPATCVDVPAPGTGFECGACPPGYTTPGGQQGVICVTCPTGTTSHGDGVCVEIDGCSPNPCYGGAACTDVPAPGTGFVCAPCPPGYVGNGVTCVEEDGCSSNPCFDPATCVDVPAPGTGFECGACPPGYTTPGGQQGVICVTCPTGTTSYGDGVCVDVDDCSPNPCFGGAACTDVPAPGTGFVCAPCPPGYVGNGVTCVEENGCSSNPCFDPATCIDVPAPGTGFECGACPPGYTTPGGQQGVICVTCPTGTTSYGDGVCVDVDGCSPNPCFGGAACTDVPAPGTGFQCGACPQGYDGNGITCVDADGCAPNPCFGGAACTDVPAPGTGFLCPPCPAGYAGDGVVCAPETACDAQPCFPGVDCFVTADGFECGPCPSGSEGDGITCAPAPGRWSEPFGDAAGSLVVSDVAVTPLEQDVIATGSFTGTVTIGLDTYVAAATPPATDMFVARYDRDGNVLWSRHFAASTSLHGTNLAADATGAYVSAAVEGQVDFGTGVLADSGGPDVALLRLDAAGSVTSSQRMGRAHATGASSLAVDPAGGAFLSFLDPVDGSSLRRFDAGGALAWAEPGAFYRLATDDAGALYTLSADHVLAQRTAAGAVVASGTVAWPSGAGSSFESLALAVEAGPTPGIWIAGRFDGAAVFADGILRTAVGSQAFAEHFPAVGAVANAVRVFGGPGNEVPTRMKVDDWGRATVVGYTDAAWVGAVTLPHYGGGEDGFALTLTPGADVVAVSAFGGEGDQRLLGLDVFDESAGLDLAIGGTNGGGITFGLETYEAPAASGFVARVGLEFTGT